MAVMNKPDLDEDLMIHFGVKGMKWGRRQGKSVTGVTRHRGALLDRNARSEHRVAATLKGDKANSLVRHRAALKVGQAVLGKDRVKRLMERRITDLKAQDARLKAGKLKFADRVDLTLNVNAVELVVSNRPK